MNPGKMQFPSVCRKFIHVEMLHIVKECLPIKGQRAFKSLMELSCIKVEIKSTDNTFTTVYVVMYVDLSL